MFLLNDDRMTIDIVIFQNVLGAQCELKGNLIKTNQGVITEDECYLIMITTPGTEYFMFDKQFGTCTLYDSNERICTAYHGPEGVSSCNIS